MLLYLRVPSFVYEGFSTLIIEGFGPYMWIRTDYRYKYYEENSR